MDNTTGSRNYGTSRPDANVTFIFLMHRHRTTARNLHVQRTSCPTFSMRLGRNQILRKTWTPKTKDIKLLLQALSELPGPAVTAVARKLSLRPALQKEQLEHEAIANAFISSAADDMDSDDEFQIPRGEFKSPGSKKNRRGHLSTTEEVSSKRKVHEKLCPKH